MNSSNSPKANLHLAVALAGALALIAAAPILGAPDPGSTNAATSAAARGAALVADLSGAPPDGVGATPLGGHWMPYAPLVEAGPPAGTRGGMATTKGLGGFTGASLVEAVAGSDAAGNTDLDASVINLTEASAPSQTVVNIGMTDHVFNPQVVTVTMGTYVRWTNQGPSAHTTTSDQGLWSSPAMAPGLSTYTVRFNAAGTYPYHCALHRTEGMVGTVVVVGPAPQPTPGPEVLQGTIVFSDFGPTRSDSRLFTVEPDGSQRAQLPPSAEGWEAQPAWSPEGLRVAFAGGGNGNPWRIHVLDLMVPAHHAFSSGPEDYEPDWNPDGGRIVFSRYHRTGGPGTPLARSGIWIMAPDGSGERPLVSVEGGAYTVGNPAWSPDGTRIAFSLSAAVGGGEIYVMQADGSNPRRLIMHSGWDDIDPAWSPDGRYIAWASGVALGNQTQHDIWVADLVTGRAGTVARHGSFPLRGPAWSPDANHIAFAARSGSGTAAQWSLYRVSGRTGQITGPLTPGAEPDWARQALVPTPTPGGPTQEPPGTVTVPPFPTFPPGTPPPPPPFPTPGEPDPTSTGPVPTFAPPTDEPTATLDPTPITVITDTPSPVPTTESSPTPGGSTWRIFAPTTYNRAGMRPG